MCASWENMQGALHPKVRRQITAYCALFIILFTLCSTGLSSVDRTGSQTKLLSASSQDHQSSSSANANLVSPLQLPTRYMGFPDGWFLPGDVSLYITFYLIPTGLENRIFPAFRMVCASGQGHSVFRCTWVDRLPPDKSRSDYFR